MTRCRHGDKFLLTNLVGLYQQTQGADQDHVQDQVAEPVAVQLTTGPGAAEVTTPSADPRPPEPGPSPGHEAEKSGPGAEGPRPPPSMLADLPAAGVITRSRAKTCLL